jgi:hypothetical protein
MDVLCTSPRNAGRLARNERPALSRGLFALGTLVSALAISGCSILFPPSSECPDTQELCPSLECEFGPVINDDGCAICECAEQAAPVICWDDADCTGDLSCDAENFCETPPGCTDDQPCPAVCYGRCVDSPAGCSDDGDCDDGERCREGAGDPRPVEEDGPAGAPPPDSGEDSDAAPCDPSTNDCFAPPPEEDPPEPPPPSNTGVCVPAGCEGELDVPACPPGTEPTLTFADDECGRVTCTPVDDCRALEPEICEVTPGCRVEAVPVPCDCAAPAPDDGDQGAPCACPDVAELVCVADETGEGCEALSAEECEVDPDCELHFFGSAGVPCVDECDSNGDCFVACPEPDPTTGEEEFVCLPHEPPPPPGGECFGDFDCVDGQRCELGDVCSGTCEPTPTGEVCTDECMLIGFCVDDPQGGCADRSADECGLDGRCALDAAGNCVPAEPEGCLDTGECGPNEVCETTTTCPECNDPNDLGCLAPCWLEGRCVPLPPPPPPPACTSNDQCGTGFVCTDVEVCEEICDGDSDPNSGVPVQCTTECTLEGQCRWDDSNVTCWWDGDCGSDEYCAYLDNCVIPPDCPNCLIACMGVCEATPEPTHTPCMTGEECGLGETCDTVNYCDAAPDCVQGEPCIDVCYGRCVDDGSTHPEGACLEQDDCPENQRCATELDSCYCPQNTTCDVCYWQCVDDTTGGTP